MDLTHADAFFLLVEMEQRVFVTARSRAATLDVGEALRTVGGGGHAAAASAVVKDQAARRCAGVLGDRRLPPLGGADGGADLMSQPCAGDGRPTVDGARRLPRCVWAACR